MKEARLTPDKVEANGPQPKRRKALKIEGLPDASRGAPALPSSATADDLNLVGIVCSLEAVWHDSLCPRTIPSNVLGMGEHPARSTRHHQGQIDEWQPTIPGLVLRLVYVM